MVEIEMKICLCCSSSSCCCCSCCWWWWWFGEEQESGRGTGTPSTIEQTGVGVRQIVRTRPYASSVCVQCLPM
jgi:hypothetical protein